jgi:uncharacterized protein YukJ
MSHHHHQQHKHQTKHSNRKNHGHFPPPQRSGDKINYHVLKCRPILNRSSPQVQNQHLQVLLEIESGQHYWMTINIRNAQDKVLYYLDEDYTHSITQHILDAELPQGFTKLESKPGGLALDYIRLQLFDFSQLVGLEANLGEATTSDLEEMLTTQITNCFRFEDARMYVFGSRFDDGERFSSYNLPTGIHDIHMNQGSVGAHTGSNGIYQSGGLLIFYPTEKRWSAVFMKFQTQATKTDEKGNPVAQ